MTVRGGKGGARISNPGASVLDRVQEEHQQIAGLLDELERTGDRGRIPELLDELASILPGHFSHEEGVDGLFEQLRMQRPQADSQLKSIEREHRSLLQALEALRAKARERGEDPARIEGAKTAFVRKLHRHERAENLVVLDVFFEDEGGSG